MAVRKRLGDLLVSKEIITYDQLIMALEIQKKSEKRLGQVLVSEKIITEEQLFHILEEQFGIPYVDLSTLYIDPKVPKMIPESIARKYTVIPIKFEKNALTVAMIDPLDIIALDDLRLFSGVEIDPVISPTMDISRAINRYYDTIENAQRAVEEFQGQIEFHGEFIEQEDADVTNAPMVRFVNDIISRAVKLKASDIHIEPFERVVRIRYRVDGELRESMSPEKSAHPAIVTRIKIMGKMNISEKRLPQDGRVETIIDGVPIDMRISVLPTVYGEKIVIRLLDRNALVVRKEDLGFTDHNFARLEKILKVPEGVVLVTGPTGSGKTTTLYSILKELNQVNKNIITVEDPVEYRLEGINQVQVNTKAGLTFAEGLRSILRQDPDIIMVGEIRDVETAEIAVRSAITGHMVLSTIHTNDTVSTISRLEDMGIASYMISSAVVGIIAQRLVKKVCPKCKESYEPTADELQLLGFDPHQEITLFKARGCNVCNHSGYLGRTAIHEVLVLDNELKQMISTKASIEDIREVSKQKGLILLRETCQELVIEGITTVEEMIRMTYHIEV